MYGLRFGGLNEWILKKQIDHDLGFEYCPALDRSLSVVIVAMCCSMGAIPNLVPKSQSKEFSGG